MTIKRIRINGLFGTFDHEIKLNNNVVIIMGENGVGKTITLNMIEAIFTKNFQYLIDKQFDEILISFHKETWHITRRSNNTDLFGDNSDVELVFQSSRKDVESFQITETMLMPRIPYFFERVGADRWFNRRNGMYYNRMDLVDRYSGENTQFEIPEWYQTQCDCNRVKLIRTQRLFQEEDRHQQMLSVKKYSQELSALMQEEISKAAKNTGDLDRTFPKRLLRQMRSTNTYSSSDILSELKRLEERRLKLSDLGLLTELESKDTFIEELQQDDNTILSVMHLYVKDSWEKLKKYDNLFEKLSLLKDIINCRYKHKVFSFDSKEGFVIQSSDSQQSKKIPVEMLSSGEQNELVLFYEMLFKCDSKDLVLIDEPEISLHLEWMQSMIGDLKRVADKNKMSLLIATHSPDLVGENYELVQHLS